MSHNVVTPQVDTWVDRSSESADMLLSSGAGGGTYGGMDARLTALETHFEYVRRDLDELKSGQTDTNRVLADVSAGLVRVSSQMTVDKAEIRADLSKLPTQAGLWTMVGVVAASALAVVAAVIGGLGWLATIIPAG